MNDMARAAALPFLSGENGRTRYLEEIRRFPMLEPQEEFILAKRWRKHNDRDAAHKLVTSHLQLVVKIAVGYRGYGLPISDLISEGNVGLIQAVERFEPDKGFRLTTYATAPARRAVLPSPSNRKTATRRSAKRSWCSTTASAEFSRRAASPMRSSSRSSPTNSASRASACGRSRCPPSRRCKRR
jgi:DNA-directed RNA polymerase sigma subunit (sigma70/sigma32)